MKYLLLGLVLLLVPWAPPSAGSPRSPDGHLDAWFQVTGPDGVVTDANVFVETHQGRAEVRLSLDRSAPACPSDPGACPVGAISANTVVTAAPGDFVLAPDLTWAALHATIPVFDAISRTQRNVRIDLDWSATGGAYHVAGADQSVVYHAIARGFVARATAEYVAGGRSDSGTIGRY